MFEGWLYTSFLLLEAGALRLQPSSANCYIRSVTRLRFALLLLVLFAGYLFWTWDGSAPEVAWPDLGTSYGRGSSLGLAISDQGGGLKQVRVEIQQGEISQEVFAEEYRSLGWFERLGTPHRPVAISLKDVPLKQGEFEVVVTASDQPVLGLWSRSSESRQKLNFDARPPLLRVTSSTHVIRQGGSELTVFESDEALKRVGVAVGERFYPGYLVEQDPRRYVAIFALAHDEDPDAQFTVIGEDEAGNQTRVRLFIEIVRVSFRSRRINISDSFIEKVASEIIPRTEEIEAGTTLEETFLKINSDLRVINHKFITNLSKKSSATALWDQPFRQLSRSRAEANFADRRTYIYDGREVDRQTHQGFDLASVARSPVEAANGGRVLFADYLGIYGNCVILDHGLGLLSLYGHLSALEVVEGDTVQLGQSLGRTGETGLAGGDHLHFSTIVSGVQVSPLEWWDPSWVTLHVRNRLNPPVADEEAN